MRLGAAEKDAFRLYPFQRALPAARFKRALIAVTLLWLRDHHPETLLGNDTGTAAPSLRSARVVAQIEPAGDRFSRLKLIGTFAATDVAVDVFMDYLAQAWQSRPPRSHSSQALPVAPI
jgi:hypothetical protein